VPASSISVRLPSLGWNTLTAATSALASFSSAVCWRVWSSPPHWRKERESGETLLLQAGWPKGPFFPHSWGRLLLE